MHVAVKAEHHPTRAVARFVSGLAFERIPAEVPARIKLLILDSLGLKKGVVSTQRIDGHDYDVHKFLNRQTGDVVTIYFNIDLPRQAQRRRSGTAEAGAASSIRSCVDSIGWISIVPATCRRHASAGRAMLSDDDANSSILPAYCPGTNVMASSRPRLVASIMAS